MKRKRWKKLPAILMLFVGIKLAAQYPVPEFVNHLPEKTESGYIKLSWRTQDAQSNNTPFVFELQQAVYPDFEQSVLIYRGHDYATFLSGLPDGHYYYRLRSTSPDGARHSDWSEPVSVRVEHHSLRLAFLLFGIGATVFLLTIGIVVKGIRSSEETSDGTSI